MTRRFHLLILALSMLALVSCSSSSAKKEKDPVESSNKQNGIQNAAGDSEESNPPEESGNEAQSESKKSEIVSEVPSADLYKKFDQARATKQNRSVQETAGELLARNPGDPRVLNGLAALAIDQDKLDLARLFVAKIFEKNPGNSSALNNLGVIELRSGNLRLALANFKKSIESDNKNKFAHANLGTVYLQYRNYQNAEQELQQAVDDGDQSMATLSNLGFAHTGTGRFDEAAKIYEKALSRESSNSIVMLNYAALLIEHQGKPDKGIKLLNKIRFVAHEPAILDKAEVLAKMAENPKKQEKESPVEKPSE